MYITGCNGKHILSLVNFSFCAVHCTVLNDVFFNSLAGSVLDNLLRLQFFDKPTQKDLLFPSIHDAVLSSQLKVLSVSQMSLNADPFMPELQEQN